MGNENHPIIVVGLGNPGSEYKGTRHNIGFMVVDELSRRLKCSWKPGKSEYEFSQKIVADIRVVLVKPLTFMNNSGEAVLDVLEHYPTPLRKVIAIVDDFTLSLGRIRVRTKGSDGGHNGLRSLIYHLNSNDFPRIKCGIKREVMPPKSEMSDFVLSPFDEEEKKLAEKMIYDAADCVEEFVRSGIGHAMNVFNKQGPSDPVVK